MWRKATVRVGRQHIPCHVLQTDETIMTIHRDGVWELYLSRRLIQQARDRAEFKPTVERLTQGRPIVYPSEAVVQVDMFKEVKR